MRGCGTYRIEAMQVLGYSAAVFQPGPRRLACLRTRGLHAVEEATTTAAEGWFLESSSPAIQQQYYGALFGMATDLLGHQRRNLAWMLEQEAGDAVPWGFMQMGPHYYAWPTTMFHRGRPAPVRGGILADQVGMGKTVSTIACICASPAPAPTLVVVPLTLMHQWTAEVKEHAPHLTVYEYYGARRRLDRALAADVVVTTYNIVCSDGRGTARARQAYFDEQNARAARGELREGENLGQWIPPLERHRWERVVFDEAQTISIFSVGGRACRRIPRERTWLLTGTPLRQLDECLLRCRRRV